MEQIHTARKAAFMRSLDPRQKARFRSCGGPGSGAYLLAQEKGVDLMPSGAWKVATRDRLLSPLEDVVSPEKPATHCQHRSRDGGCRKVLRGDGAELHCNTCKVGGGVLKIHNEVRDVLWKFVQEHVDPHALREQRLDIPDIGTRLHNLKKC